VAQSLLTVLLGLFLPLSVFPTAIRFITPPISPAKEKGWHRIAASPSLPQFVFSPPRVKFFRRLARCPRMPPARPFPAAYSAQPFHPASASYDYGGPMHRSRLLFSLLSLALLFTVACNKSSDDSITTDIKAKMFSEPLLKTSTVNVSVKGGTVTLSGQLSDDAARLAAERLAASTNGVSKVIDQTTVPIPAPVFADSVQPPAPTPAPPASRLPRTSRPQAAPAPSTSLSVSPEPSLPVNHPVETQAAPAPILADASAPTPAAAPAPPPPPPPPLQPITSTIPGGTVVTVRTIDNIDSTTSQTGQTFRGSLDAPILIDGRVVVPKGLNVNLKLVAASSGGKFNGASELTVSLDSFTYQGKTYHLSSSSVQEKGESRGKRSGAVIGGGAALGAIIGGLAGGGRGAAIGAGLGAGGGAAVQATTKGQQVRIRPETHLDFTLRDPLDVTFIPSQKSSHATSTAAPPAVTDQPPANTNPPPTTDQPPASDTPPQPQ